MKANFQFVPLFDSPIPMSQKELDKHAEHLIRNDWTDPGRIDQHELPEGFENYYAVDVIGTEFIWMNNTFPKERFTWYLWFESVFLVPEEMVPFLILKWEGMAR